MGVITISRELGSLGTKIAHALSDRLGYRLVWREVINEAAVRAGSPEVALAVIDDLGLLGLKPNFRARSAYHEAVNQVMRELAAEGRIVIVGRAGQVILQDLSDILHVRVIAPVALRIERIAARRQISPAAAKELVDQSDQTRRHYLRRTYHVDWRDPALYDLVINTMHLDVVAGVDLIVQAWRSLEDVADTTG